ncbi:hypothetical protein OIU34_33840 [Pararhizobium sp. BT-229]|nr:hypothetical protein [Pararhizobium sp. BT-229]MCV9966835.1 hypothetical protein [Pararhizobium sp. BT-229]
MNGLITDCAPSTLLRFEQALAKLPDGHSKGRFGGRRWSATIQRSPDGRRIWLYAEELGGRDVVSFNLYKLVAAGPMLKPCEMSSAKVTDFVLGFQPDLPDAGDRDAPSDREPNARARTGSVAPKVHPISR